METSSSKSNLRSLINQVTKEKLELLDRQRQTLKSYFSTILEKFERAENKGSVKFLKEIYTAMKACPIACEEYKSADFAVFLNWVQVEDQDAVVYFGSEHLVRHWIEKFITTIKFQIEKCEYSCLYANVMTQYMDVNSEDNLEDDDVVMVEAPAPEGGAESDRDKTIQEFSERVFSPCNEYNTTEFNEFLNTKLFKLEDPQQSELLNGIRWELKKFCDELPTTCNQTLDMEHIQCVIDGLLAEDLLGPDKTSTLKELRENEDAINEVCTLLKNRIQSFKQWSWPGAVQVNFRRNMAGRYRAYMDEDIITALLLHYLGAVWSIQMKKVFKKIYHSKMWKRGTGTLGDLYFQAQSIEGFREEFRQAAFLSILPNKLEDLAQTAAIYEDEDGNNKKARNNKIVLTPMKVKQKLLHLISNEVNLNFILRPDSPFVLAQTDIEWFGPSLVHDAIISVMKFFGVTEPWLDFFKKFLETPLIVGQESSQAQIRKRGAPLSHAFSSLFGESILFIMDLYVNQVSGLSLLRIHDDFWFWGHKTEVVVKAWTAIQEYAAISGLKLNQEKTASVMCKPDSDPTSVIHGPQPLAQTKVKWGFIVMHSDGVFRINQELLQPHVKEMRECLLKSETVMSWVHCHNRYIRFFIRNFAEPAQTFQKQHVVQILKTLHAIMIDVHKEANGDPVEALKKKFAKIWENKDVMDSWVHWPVKDGGLGLYNPFLDFIPLHEAYKKSEEEVSSRGFGSTGNKFAKVMSMDRTNWEKILEESKKRRKRRFTESQPSNFDEDTVTDHEASDHDDDDEDYDSSSDERQPSKNKKSKGKNPKKRIGFELWCERYRETMWGRWRSRYCELLNNLEAVKPEDSSTWRDRMYSEQLENKFGGDSFINTDLIPLSLISAMQAARVHKN